MNKILYITLCIFICTKIHSQEFYIFKFKVPCSSPFSKDTAWVYKYDLKTQKEQFIAPIRLRYSYFCTLDSIWYDTYLSKIDLAKNDFSIPNKFLSGPYYGMAQKEEGITYYIYQGILKRIKLSNVSISDITKFQTFLGSSHDNGANYFYNHELLHFSQKEVYKLDTTLNGKETLLFTVDKPWLGYNTNLIEDCDTSRIITFSAYEGVLELDWNNKKLVKILDYKVEDYYLFSPNVKAPLRYLSCLDLDKNNSTINKEKDFQIKTCKNTAVKICDDDIKIKTRPGFADSLHIWIDKGLKDTGNEELILSGAMHIGIKMKKTSDGFWFYFPKDYEEVKIENLIKQVFYRNNKALPSIGERQVKMYLYTGRAVSDPAIAYIYVGNNTEKSIMQDFCDGSTYIYKGQNYNVSKTFYDSLKAIVTGCDSIIVHQFTINPKKENKKIATTCDGKPYNFYGQLLTQNGNYEKKWQTSKGCDSTEKLSLTVLPKKERKFTAITCEGTPYNFYGKILTQAGDYEHTISNVTDCDSTEKLTLIVFPKKENKKSATTCEGLPYNFYGQSLTQSGDYQLALQTTKGCDSLEKLTLKVLPNPKFSLPNELTILQGASENVKITTTEKDSVQLITWIPSKFLDKDNALEVKISPTENIVYQVVIKNKNGCESSNTLNVWLREEKKVFIPTIFSPNDDNFNDVFQAFINSTDGVVEEYEIFDRWGTKIHHSDEEWSGKEYPNGVYIYIIKILWRDGKSQIINGDVNLVR